MIRLVASDMDGTLVGSYLDRVDPQLYTIIKTLKERGIRFMAASGRQYFNLRNHFLPVADDIDYLCENGCLVFHEGELLLREQMREEYARELLEVLEETPGYQVLVSGVHTSYILDGNAEFYHMIADELGNRTTLVDDFYHLPEPYFKVAAWKKDEQEVIAEVPHWQKLFGDRLTAVYSGNHWVDFSPLHVSKGTAISQYMERMGYGREEVMAFGDNYNDETMLDKVKYSFAMRRAPREIRDFAYGTTDNVKETLLQFFKDIL